MAEGKHVEEGSTVNLPDPIARELISIGRAVATGKDAEEELSSETAHLVPKDHAAGPEEDASADPKKARNSGSGPRSRADKGVNPNE